MHSLKKLIFFVSFSRVHQNMEINLKGAGSEAQKQTSTKTEMKEMPRINY